MKTIKILQNEVGHFNLIGNEKSHSFTMAILEDDQIIKDESGNKAIAYFSASEDDIDDDIVNYEKFENLSSNFDEILNRCADYCFRVISTHNYKENFLVFMDAYKKYYDEIDGSLLDEFQEVTQIKINSLKNELEFTDKIISSPSSIANFHRFKKRIDALQKNAEYVKKNMEDLKETSDPYIKGKIKLEQLELEISRMKGMAGWDKYESE